MAHGRELAQQIVGGEPRTDPLPLRLVRVDLDEGTFHLRPHRGIEGFIGSDGERHDGGAGTGDLFELGRGDDRGDLAVEIDAHDGHGSRPGDRLEAHVDEVPGRGRRDRVDLVDRAAGQCVAQVLHGGDGPDIGHAVKHAVADREDRPLGGNGQHERGATGTADDSAGTQRPVVQAVLGAKGGERDAAGTVRREDLGLDVGGGQGEEQRDEDGRSRSRWPASR